jgi:hypothetical protein
MFSLPWIPWFRNERSWSCGFPWTHRSPKLAEMARKSHGNGKEQGKMVVKSAEIQVNHYGNYETNAKIMVEYVE